MSSRSSDEKLGSTLSKKGELEGPPKIYLGGHVCKVKLDNVMTAWPFRSSQYVRTAVKNVEEYLKADTSWSWKLLAKAETPMQASHRPELDVLPELYYHNTLYYQSLIGVLKWIVELGRVDICLEVLMLLSHLALLCEAHLEQIFQTFAI